MHILYPYNKSLPIATIDLYTIKNWWASKEPTSSSTTVAPSLQGNQWKPSSTSQGTLLLYLREQDEKIYTRRKRFAYGKGITVFALSIIPVAYLAYVTYNLPSPSLLDIGETSTTQVSSPLLSRQSKATSESTLSLSFTSRKERSERSSLASRTPSNFAYCSKNQHRLDQYLKTNNHHH